MMNATRGPPNDVTAVQVDEPGWGKAPPASRRFSRRARQFQQLVRELRLPAVNPLRQQIEEMPGGAKVIAGPEFGAADAVNLAVGFLRKHRHAGHHAFL